MNRNARFYRDKQLLALERELISRHPKKPVMVPLDPPEDRGWVQHFRLTRAAALRPDAAVLRTILRELDVMRFSNTRQFGVRKSWGRQRRLHFTDLTLKSIDPGNWPRMGWPHEWLRRYFVFVRRFSFNHWTQEFVFTHEDCFEVFSERYYVRELPFLDPAQERREAELQAGIGAVGWDRLRRLHGRSLTRWEMKDIRKIKTRMARHRVRAALRGDSEAEGNRQTAPGRFLSASLPDFHFFLPV